MGNDFDILTALSIDLSLTKFMNFKENLKNPSSSFIRLLTFISLFIILLKNQITSSTKCDHRDSSARNNALNPLKAFRLDNQQIKDLNLSVSLASSDLQLVKKVKITDEEDKLCCLLLSNTTKKLYNSALYLFKKQYKLNQTVLSYGTLDKLIKNERLFPHFTKVYRDVPTRIAQQALRLFDQNIKSFFALKQSDKLTDAQKKRVKLPRYYAKNGLTVVTYDSSALLKTAFDKEGVLLLSGTDLKIKRERFPEIKDFSQIDQVRIVPSSRNDKNKPLSNLLDDPHFHFTVEIVYSLPLSEARKNNHSLHVLHETVPAKKIKGKYTKPKEQIAEIYGTQEFMHSVAGIDQNLDQLSVGLITDEAGTSAFNYDIKYLKSVNQYWNKKRAELQAEIHYQEERLHNLKNEDDYGNVKELGYYKSFLTDYTVSQLIEDTEILIKKLENKVKRLTTKRNQKVDNYTHQLSRKLITHLSQLGVRNVIYGKNVNLKQEINLGKVNNQNFVQIPFNQLIERLRYKALLAGMNFMTVEESYTSKTSFLDREKLHQYKNDKPKKDYAFLGKRFSRSLFRSQLGYVIHADVNASFNIIRKVSGNEIYNYVDLGSIRGSSPKRMRIALQ